MAKAKTGSFYIRRAVDCSSTTAQLTTIDTSAYVDPADRQGLMIESVDFMFYNKTTFRPFVPSSDTGVAVQLLSGAYSDLVSYTEEDMIASANLVMDAGAGVYETTNQFPDILGTPDGKIVVDDQLSILGEASTASTNLECALLIKAKVVTLTNKDYMALALQTVAN